jgi:hypothetical protein
MWVAAVRCTSRLRAREAKPEKARLGARCKRCCSVHAWRRKPLAAMARGAHADAGADVEGAGAAGGVQELVRVEPLTNASRRTRRAEPGRRWLLPTGAAEVGGDGGVASQSGATPDAGIGDVA